MEICQVLSPSSMEEAKKLMAKYKNIKILAGGTDLSIDINKDKTSPEYLLSLRKIEGIKKIKDFQRHIVIGSMVTFSDILESDTISANFNALKECAAAMGSPQIRNAATVGGNIANAAPAADIIPCLMCLDASIDIVNPEGSRVTKVADYIKNYRDIKLKPNEIIKEIVINKNNSLNGFYKLGKRNSLAISRINCVISINLENNNVKKLKVALGAVGRLPFRVTALEKMAENKEVDFLISSEAFNMVETAVYESIKERKTMPFKKEAVKGVYKEAVKRALGGYKNE